MKLCRKKCCASAVGLLLMVIFWSICADAQNNPETRAVNPPTSSSSTNSVVGAGKTTNVEQRVLAAQRRPALLDRQVTFGLDRVELLQWEVYGNPLWKYVASLLYIILALYIAKLLDYLFHA